METACFRSTASRCLLLSTAWLQIAKHYATREEQSGDDPADARLLRWCTEKHD